MPGGADPAWLCPYLEKLIESKWSGAEMLRSSMFFVLVTFFSIVHLESSVQGEDERVTRFLEKAIEHAPDEQSLDFVRIAFLHGYNQNWEAALDFIKRSEERLGERNPIRDQFFQLIILSGHTNWLEEHQIPVPWETNEIYAARAVFFAREGNAELAIEFAEKIKSPDYSHKIYCEVTRQLCLAGENEAARGVFMRALSQKEGRVSHDLFQAALALRYRPLILEMYDRLVKQENLINIPPLDLLAQLAASGLITESAERSDSFGELSLKALPRKMWDYARQDPTKKNYDRLMAIAGDPSDARLKNASAQSHLFYSRLASGDIQSAEAFANSRTPLTTRLSALVNVSHAYAKNKDLESSTRVLNSAQELLEKLYLNRDEESEKMKLVASIFFVRDFAKIGALRILNGDVEAGKQLLERAASVAEKADSNRKNMYPSSRFQVVGAYLICNRPTVARDILIDAVKSKQMKEQYVTLNRDQSINLIEALLVEGGVREARKLFDVVKFGPPRFTLTKLIALEQLRQEGPDADIDWVFPDRKDVPIEELFLLVAEERLAEKAKERIALFQSVLQADPEFILINN